MNARTLCIIPDFDIVRYIVMAAAINLIKLIDSLFCSSLGNLYCHANPSVLYPPNLCLQASENVTMVGFVKVTLLILIPCLDTTWRISIQRCISSFSVDVICWDPYLEQR